VKQELATSNQLSLIAEKLQLQQQVCGDLRDAGLRRRSET
jgi:hypothetical protein